MKSHTTSTGLNVSRFIISYLIYIQKLDFRNLRIDDAWLYFVHVSICYIYFFLLTVHDHDSLTQLSSAKVKKAKDEGFVSSRGVYI